LFDDFADVWTIAGLARDLRQMPVQVRVAGQRIVLFRGSDGKPAALIDRCPHRGVALSLGKVEGGNLVCPFHGWRFSPDGSNCHVPWSPDAKRELLGATAIPVREAKGLIWLYTGFAPAAEPMPPDVLDAPGAVVCAQSVLWSVHWTRVMENMLDTPHLPFVHSRTIGRGLRKVIGQTMAMNWEERPYGARITSSVGGQTRGGALDFRFPNAMELFIDPPGRMLRLLAVCLPEDGGATRLTIYTIRNFARLRILDPVFRRMNRAIADEDRAIVESSDPPIVPPPELERSVATDLPTLAFRRIWRSRLQGSSAQP